MTKNNPKIRIWETLMRLFALTGMLFALISCANRHYNGQCDYPETISEETIFGIWQLEYADFYVSHFGYETTINGQEEIIFGEGGTYSQTFTSGDYNYSSNQNRWELITNTPDSPKIKLYGMKYFAYGIENTSNLSQLVLDPQTTDFLKNQNAKETGTHVPNPSVAYPNDGYIFLYPRLCSGHLSLLQMVVRPRDPDNVSVLNPVFTR